MSFYTNNAASGGGGGGGGGQQQLSMPSQPLSAMHQIVSTYLQRQAYKQSEIAFSAESGTLRSGGNKANPMLYDLFELFCSNHAVATGYAVGEEAVTKPEECYTKTRDWIQKALDMYKPELHALLYPLFMYLFFHLINKDEIKEAKRFFEAHSKDHEGFHKEEMDRVQYIASKQHLNENPVAQLFWRSRYKIQLSREGLNLLLSFIMEHQILLVLRILANHFEVETLKISPDDATAFFKRGVGGGAAAAAASSADGEANGAEGGGGAGAAVAAGGGGMQFGVGLSAGGLLYKDKTLRWPKPFEQQVIEKYDTLRTELGQHIIKKRARIEKLTPQQSIPLPSLSDETEMQIVRDVLGRVPVNAESKPSVCFHTFFNTKSSMNCGTVSADGALIATGMSDSAIKVWSPNPENYHSQSALFTRLGHSGPVYGLDYSEDNKFLISSSEDGTVRLWGLEQQTNLVAYRGHNFPVWDVAFSPLGLYFVSASHDRTARLWSTERIHFLRLFVGHFSDVDCVTFHPNCNYIATGSTDQSLRLWDIHSGDCVRVFSGHPGPVTCVKISPCGKYIASGGEKGEVLLWDIGSSQIIAKLGSHYVNNNNNNSNIEGNVVGSENTAVGTAVHSLAFSMGDGATLASGGEDCCVRLWDVRGATSGGEGGGVAEVRGSGKDHNPNAILALPTKQTSVHFVRFTRTNLLLAGGPYLGSSSL